MLAWPSRLGRLEVACTSVVVFALAGCDALLGVDWDRVTVSSASGARDGDGGSASGAGGAASPGTAPGGPDTSGASGDSDAGTDPGGVTRCTPPKVSCIAGCCDANDDPGLPVGIAAGPTSSCTVTSTGKVRCWGLNNTGQLGRGTGKDLLTPATAYNIPSGASAVAIGSVHGCAVVGDRVGCWGADPSGQLGFDAASTTGVEEPGRVRNLRAAKLAVAVGMQHSCALADGTVFCWGANDDGQLGDRAATPSSAPRTVAMFGTGARAVAASGNTTCAVTREGAVTCWGEREEPYAITGITDAVQITLGSMHGCVLRQGGGVLCWGSNLYAELGAPSNGGDTPVAPVGLPSRVVSLSAGGMHTCAVAEGAVWCWGSNTTDELGRDTGNTSGAPAVVPGLNGAKTVAAGRSHTCVLLDNGKVTCWGDNSFGQLGNGTKDRAKVPVAVTWP